MVAYFAVFNDFGFPPSQLTMIANVPYFKSNDGDVFNPSHPTFGNTKLYSDSNALTICPTTTDTVDWVYLVSSNYDLRVTMLECTKQSTGSVVFSQKIKSWGTCNVQQISPVTNKPVCYTT